MVVKLDIDALSEIYSDQLFFELTPGNQELAFTQVRKGDYPNDSAYWNAYVNQLCLNKFITYIDSELDFKQSPSVWSYQNGLAPFWSIVNGCVLCLDGMRLALIPVQTSDMTEFRVQREWLDLTSWASHYFMAIQVNLDDGWLQVWGYSTHQQFREFGVYDPIDETYSLPIEEITEDLSVFWVTQELSPTPNLIIDALPELSQSQAEKLLVKLAAEKEYSPRLQLPFEQWGAFISNEQYLQKLYHRRLQSDVAQSNELVSQLTAMVNDLGQWLQQGLSTGWQAFDEVFSAPSDNMAFALRHNQATTRGIAIEGVKLIDLGVQLGHQSVALVVGITPMEEKRMGVQVQLLPSDGHNYLPTGVKLSLLSKSSKVLQESVARYQDTLMQLKRFSCPESKGFLVRIALGEFELIETFEIKPRADV